MGKSFYGDIWKPFWIDDRGREYDPEEVSKKVWAYLDEIGYTQEIDAGQRAGNCTPWMRIVSVEPVVILMIPCQHRRFAGTDVLVAHGTRSALELSFVSDLPLYFDEPMQWASPDLQQGPTTISFSEAGDAEIPLRKGKLTLHHEGESCLVHRE